MDGSQEKTKDLSSLPFLTLAQVAELLQVSRYFVMGLIKAKQLPYAVLSPTGARTKPTYRFRREDVEEYVRQHMVTDN